MDQGEGNILMAPAPRFSPFAVADNLVRSPDKGKSCHPQAPGSEDTDKTLSINSAQKHLLFKIFNSPQATTTPYGFAKLKISKKDGDGGSYEKRQEKSPFDPMLSESVHEEES
ncbi:hypothetical protein H8959_001795 [Pygathrix nigripes]